MSRTLRRRLEPLVRRWWRGEAGGWAPLFTATALLPQLGFSTAVRFRTLLFDTRILRMARAPVPVVSVGNLSVGGTGKTPVVRWVVEELVALGRRPAVVLRGYGEDEAMLHTRWNPQVPVIRSPDRIEGVRRAAEMGCDVAVLDDGFQHRRLARDLDLVLLSPSQPLPARLLPRGPYREPLRALRRASLVFVTAKGGEGEGADQLVREARSMAGAPPVYRLPLEFEGWQGLGGEPLPAPQGNALVVASVGQPEALRFEVARLLDRPVELLAFPDHHAYRVADVARISEAAGGRSIVTTEKDAVKLEPFRDALPSCHVLALAPRPAAFAAAALRGELARAVGEWVPTGGKG